MIFSCLLLIGLFEIMSSIIVDVIEENPKANLKEAWHLILSVIRLSTCFQHHCFDSGDGREPQTQT